MSQTRRSRPGERRGRRRGFGRRERESSGGSFVRLEATSRCFWHQGQRRGRRQVEQRKRESLKPPQTPSFFPNSYSPWRRRRSRRGQRKKKKSGENLIKISRRCLVSRPPSRILRQALSSFLFPKTKRGGRGCISRNKRRERGPFPVEKFSEFEIHPPPPPANTFAYSASTAAPSSS